jgi:hypothetical protein
MYRRDIKGREATTVDLRGDGDKDALKGDGTKARMFGRS